MRTYRVTQGPFSEGVYYTDEEIENTCSDELRAVGLLPATPEPIRIGRFIEKKFGVTPEYDNLPEGMLGCTKFGPKGVQAIVVSRALSEEGTRGSERLLDTTLAHEGGHGLFHAHLFALGRPPQSLFDPEESQSNWTRILCREDAVLNTHRSTQHAYSGKWWEFQANRAIGGLLLPRQLVAQCLEEVLVARGTLGSKVLPQDRREQAVRLVSETFNVNPVVARIRIDMLYPAGAEAQLTL